MLIFLYIINFILLASCLLIFLFRSGERQFTLSLIRTLMGLPLLAGEYIYFGYNFEPEAAHLVLLSECIFSLIWIFMAQRLHEIGVEEVSGIRALSLAEIGGGAVLGGLTAYFLMNPPALFLGQDFMVFNHYGGVYFYSLFLLASMVFMAWRMEEFWRGLRSNHRWQYKFLAVGVYLVCGVMIWTASYRVAYLRFVPDHFVFLGALIFLGWGLMAYAVVRHRLLNRKIFISRKIVYSAVAPLAFGIYLLGLGAISLIMRYFGLPLSVVLEWSLAVLGVVAVFLYIHSGKIRRRVHFFISTHFYVNKYEYRDEWLNFSNLLKGAFTEGEVVKALNQVLGESLYTTNLSIWVGDEERGYQIISSQNPTDREKTLLLGANDPLIGYLKKHGHFYIEENNPIDMDEEGVQKKRELLTKRNLTLLVPISISDQVIGLIGLGREYTGGRYGKDDYDLLAALGTQAASALLAVRMGEQLARTRQIEAWNALSAFVMHDLKNVASTLSLTMANLPAHFDNPEFRSDAVRITQQGLTKINKICAGLSSLTQKMELKRTKIDLNELIVSLFPRLNGGVKATLIQDLGPLPKMFIDPEQVHKVLTNLILNANEATANGGEIHVSTKQRDGWVTLTVRDNGCGMSKEFMERSLFRPFKTTKKQGMGIGLFQSKMIIEAHGGRIEVESEEGKGSTFSVFLPVGERE